MGRPRKAGSTTLGVVLPPTQRAQLEEFADAEGLSLSDAVRLLLETKDDLIAARLRARQQIPPVTVVQLPPDALVTFREVMRGVEALRADVRGGLHNYNQQTKTLHEVRQVADQLAADGLDEETVDRLRALLDLAEFFEPDEVRDALDRATTATDALSAQLAALTRGE